MAFIRFTEYASTVIIRTFSGSFAGAILSENVYRKNNASVNKSGSNGVTIADKYLGQYNKIDCNLADDVEIVDLAGATVTSPFASLDALYIAINHVLQDSISASVAVSVDDWEVVEMCKMGGCSDLAGYSGTYDNNGLSQSYSLFTDGIDAAGTIEKIDFGNGDIRTPNATSYLYTYPAANLGKSFIVRIYVHFPASGLNKCFFFPITLSTGIVAGNITLVATSYDEPAKIKYLRWWKLDGDDLPPFGFIDTDLNGVEITVSDPYPLKDCCNCNEEDAEGYDVISSVVVSDDATIPAGYKSLTFTTSSDYSGNINGAAALASTSYPFIASDKKLLPSIAYTTASGSIRIDKFS